jgi:hypothetical protein
MRNQDIFRPIISWFFTDFWEWSRADWHCGASSAADLAPPNAGRQPAFQRSVKNFILLVKALVTLPASVKMVQSGYF